MIIVSAILLLVGIYLFLICPRIFHKPDTTPFRNRHYAHRGLFDNKEDAPENSLPAFEKACQHGYGIEFDVQLSKDNIPVVFHDKTLKRMCGTDGFVWDYTLKELKTMKLAGSNATIPTLEETLKVIRGRVPLIIEYKLDRVQTQVCELSEKLLADYQGVYCIESFHPFAVIWYKKNKPAIVRGQLCKEYWKDADLKKNRLLHPVSFLISNASARPDFIAYNFSDYKNISLRLCGCMGALKVAWTIRSQEDYKLVKDQFDLFIFDSCKL